MGFDTLILDYVSTAYMYKSSFCALLDLAYICVHNYYNIDIYIILLYNIDHYVGVFTDSYNFNSQKPPICATGLLNCHCSKNGCKIGYDDGHELTCVRTSIE